MEIDIISPSTDAPTRYAHTLSMTIRSFKGRRDVVVHLFRGCWDESIEAAENWESIIVGCQSCESPDSSRNVVMEAFTEAERDHIINYLKEQYSTRLTVIRSVPLNFPVPAGLTGLSSVAPDKSVGVIEFEKIPSYSLDIPLHGLYDLGQHAPIVEEDNS